MTIKEEAQTQLAAQAREQAVTEMRTLLKNKADAEKAIKGFDKALKGLEADPEGYFDAKCATSKSEEGKTYMSYFNGINRFCI